MIERGPSRHGTALKPRPKPDAPNFSKRRFWLSQAFPGETLIIPSGNAKVRANDTHFAFRPGSDFVYLTGDHEPDSVLVLRPAGSGHDAVLYAHHLGDKADQLCIETAPLAELGELLTTVVPGRTRVLRGLDPGIDRAVPVSEPHRKYAPDRGKSRDRELAWVISELKLVKDDWELGQLQSAIDATVHGFEDVARVLPHDRPVSERLLEGVFELRARHDGNGVGYRSTVGSGPHATTLRWVGNTGETRPGDLLLMDMGVEGDNFYTADVTRTVPVSGSFTPLQRQVYDIVFAAQQAAMDVIRPGVRFRDVDRTCTGVLAEGLHDLGLLAVSVADVRDGLSMLHRRWTLHDFGHMLGTDVRDCANARDENYRNGALSEGYVLAVEPGLYFEPEDDLVPGELRGIGVRIGDDVLVTADGYRNLSAGLPRASGQVEAWLAAQRAAGPRLPGAKDRTEVSR